MPRNRTTTPRRPNYRKLLEKSVAREANWKQLVEQFERRVAELEALLQQGSAAFEDGSRSIGMLTEQGRHAKGLYEAMIQRYAGVKLDQQLFTFEQANVFVTNERASMEQTLERIWRQHFPPTPRPEFAEADD